MQRLGYRLNLRTRQCEKFTLTEPFRPIEVPENATSRGAAYVGSSSVSGAGVLVDIFVGDTPRGMFPRQCSMNVRVCVCVCVCVCACVRACVYVCIDCILIVHALHCTV